MGNKAKVLNVVNWVCGLVLCSLGIALCTKASFGLSMISAPPYILHVWLRQSLPWFTQGTGEYVWEAIILVVTCIIIGKLEWRYFLSFVTAVLTGWAIDGWLWVLGGNGVYATMAGRIIAFIIGAPVISVSIAFYFKTKLPLQVYELSVKEIAARWNFDTIKVKRVFDIAMLLITGLMAIVLTHSFDGVGVGTIIVTFVNAPMIGFFSRLIDKLEGAPAEEKQGTGDAPAEQGQDTDDTAQ